MNRNNSPKQKARWEADKALVSSKVKVFKSVCPLRADYMPSQRFSTGVSDACGLGRGHNLRIGRMLRHGGIRLHGHSRNFQTEMGARNRVSYIGRRAHPDLINGVVFALKTRNQRVRQEHEAARRLQEIGLQPIELAETPRL